MIVGDDHDHTADRGHDHGGHDHHHHADDDAIDDDHGEEGGGSQPRTGQFPYSNVYPLATLDGMMKDAGLRIRINRDLRDAFLEVCRAQDRPAAQVLREFMRGYVASHSRRKHRGEKGGYSVR
jgi:hypothetical protein